MLKAALESLKRRSGDTQSTSTTAAAAGTTTQRAATNECSPISSQMSALLFSSSPSLPRKQAKTIGEQTAAEEEFGSFMMDDGDDDLEELLLRELEEPEPKPEPEPEPAESKGQPPSNTDIAVFDSSSPGSFFSATKTLMMPLSSYSSPSPSVSVVDSIYNTIDERGLPMIDFSTPQFSHRQTSPRSQKTLPLPLPLPPMGPSPKQSRPWAPPPPGIVKKLMVPGAFSLDDLRLNIKAIGSQLHLNPIEAINQSEAKRVTFLLALMLRDYRQIGSNAQLRLIDGSGREIIGTMPFSACDKELKLAYGLILLLDGVTVFRAPGGTKYLNINPKNLQGYCNNIKVID